MAARARTRLPKDRTSSPTRGSAAVPFGAAASATFEARSLAALSSLARSASSSPSVKPPTEAATVPATDAREFRTTAGVSFTPFVAGIAASGSVVDAREANLDADGTSS